MSNVAGKAYGMNVLTPMRPGLTWANVLIFQLGRCLIAPLAGLLGLRLIHFARWAMIRRDQWPDLGQGKQHLVNDYMLFVSNFNGTWDQYIDAFSDGIPNGLDLFWFSSTKYPKSIPITPFKNYIRANQIATSYYYNATPGAGQRDIKCALKVARVLRDLQKLHGGAPPADFAKAYHAALAEVQNCLGAQGYAPVASEDTAIADRNRIAIRESAPRSDDLQLHKRIPDAAPKGGDNA